jgi:hypothetical protein
MNTKALATVITALGIAAAPAQAEITEADWKQYGYVENTPHQFGRYTITTQSEQMRWYNGNTSTCVWRDIPSQERETVGLVNGFVNGTYVNKSAFFDETTASTFGSANVKLIEEDIKTIDLAEMAGVAPFFLSTHEKGDPLIGEGILALVYDRNHNGILSAREIERGNKRLSDFRNYLTETELPQASGKYILPAVESVDEFEQAFKQYKRDSDAPAPVISEHQAREKAVIEYVRKLNPEGESVSAQVGDLRITVYQGAWFVDANNVMHPNTYDTLADLEQGVIPREMGYWIPGDSSTSFSIEDDLGITYFDSGLYHEETTLDGKVDNLLYIGRMFELPEQIRAKEWEYRGWQTYRTGSLDNADQVKFENLVLEAYNAIPRGETK